MIPGTEKNTVVLDNPMELAIMQRLGVLGLRDEIPYALNESQTNEAVLRLVSAGQLEAACIMRETSWLAVGGLAVNHAVITPPAPVTEIENSPQLSYS